MRTPAALVIRQDGILMVNDHTCKDALALISIFLSQSSLPLISHQWDSVPGRTHSKFLILFWKVSYGRIA
eukprot:snap_masked-scaffold_6-processed-gene-0.32-mRNA-1 protein AED:1.00 eAED:1.00 QI:0/0/0/0/1/1/2/0/69